MIRAWYKYFSRPLSALKDLRKHPSVMATTNINSEAFYKDVPKSLTDDTGQTLSISKIYVCQIVIAIVTLLTARLR